MGKNRSFKFESGLLLAALLACLMVAGCQAGKRSSAALPGFDEIAAATRPTEQIVTPAPERWTLPNGLTVAFLPDEELPLAGGILYLRGGALLEPVDENGAVSALGDQLRQGGAGGRSADQLDRDLEMLSASVSSAYSSEFGSVSFSCLSTDIEKVFPIFADVVLRPRFEEQRLELWKGQALESIRRRVDDPETVAAIALKQLVFGPTPYGRVTIDRDIRKIERPHLLQLYKRFVRPEGAILALSGKVSRPLLERLVNQYFAAWRGEGAAPNLALPALNFTPAPGIYFIGQPLAQATVFLGQQGVKRLSPDYLAIDAFNQIFGSGGFGSLLTRRVRTELGLAYGIFGSIIPGPVKGRNIIVLQTKAETTAIATVEALRVLKAMKAEPVSAAELDETQRSITNSFVFNFDAPGKIVAREIELELLGFPRDYDRTYLPGIQALQPADIAAVAVKRWQIPDLVLVVVGNETAYAALEDLVKKPGSEFEKISAAPGAVRPKASLGMTHDKISNSRRPRFVAQRLRFQTRRGAGPSI